jgi:hypothetical protein
MAAARTPLVGNRMMLAGVVLYLSEFVAIFATGSAGIDPAKLTGVLGRTQADILASYQGREDALAFMAGWFSVVLLGRILLIVALKASLADSARPHPLMDFAVACMTVSVAIEIAAYGLVAAAAQLGAGHAEGMVAVEWSAAMMLRVVNGAIGLAVLSSAWATWRSAAFPKPLVALGAIAGVIVPISALFIAPAYDGVRMTLEISVYAFFVWMAWTAVLLWIRAPRRARTSARA